MYYTSVSVLTETDETQVGIHHTNLLMCRVGIKSTILLLSGLWGCLFSIEIARLLVQFETITEVELCFAKLAFETM